MTDKNIPKIALTPLVASLPSAVPFVGPETQERARGQQFEARLGANENGFGPSPKAIAAMQAALGDVWKYGDPESYDLKGALAKHHGVLPENIVVGEGIDALLGYLVRMKVAEGDAVVTSDGAYPTFNYHVSGFGGRIIKVPYNDDLEDPVALLEAARSTAAKLIYFANPDNPMGSMNTRKDVEAMMYNVPNGSLLVLDEAYGEFASDWMLPTIDPSNEAVIHMRTFSKAYGMAGARIGYAIGHVDLIDAFNKIRNHFGVSVISQAGALAALKDQDYLEATRRNIELARQNISDIGAKFGLRAMPSSTNFVALDCGRDGAFAKCVLEGLIARNVFVRMPFIAPQNRCIRISCGPVDALKIFENALGPALNDAE
jgi:histidinol-phosphate aminotransferase